MFFSVETIDLMQLQSNLHIRFGLNLKINREQIEKIRGFCLFEYSINVLLALNG